MQVELNTNWQVVKMRLPAIVFLELYSSTLTLLNCPYRATIWFGLNP